MHENLTETDYARKSMQTECTRMHESQRGTTYRGAIMCARKLTGSDHACTKANGERSCMHES